MPDSSNNNNYSSSSNNHRQVKSNAVSNQSPDNIEEGFWRLKIHGNDDQGDLAPSSPYPDRPGEPDCVYYLRTGLCGYGTNCRFNHPPYAAQGNQFKEELPERVGQPDCGYYLKTGTCKYGSTCKYHHPSDRNGAGPVSFNIVGLPMRQDEKSCPYYMRTGSCKFGVACKFHHPQPAPLGAGLPVTGPSATGPMTSSNTPSSGPPYVGGLPTWSLPRAPYVSGPRLQAPQTYMPVVVSPSQGVVPAQGWNTYVGNLSPMSSAGVVGSGLAYNSRNQRESGSSGQVHMLSTESSNLPERPDQPECRYFMNTGFCKYGSDCKYHHPKERIAQLATNSVGPLGLPSRPGQPVCSNYSMYGICKFGPTCRFDHPFPAYPYGYGLSLQPLSIFDLSLLNYPRISPPTLSTESGVSLVSKFPDWVQNPENATRKHQNSDTNIKISEDQSEQADSPPPHSSQASSEPSHD
ncbi:zinc finger CCCH domain-containing protein 3-like [Mercurialis annua]|uniref:zinc finger CCCH domain-containing protein 3-like n=1 Tax=Mercurialis annua TaxID=3986 RepID=UPI00215F0B91|nr:zinc finger CCCH domain-containing protein 3-like [Mercurialis annua]